MSKPLSLLAGAILIVGCTSSIPEGAKTVAEVAGNLEAFNGSKLTIVGWTGEWCGGLDCRIYRSPRDAQTLDTWDHENDEIDENWFEAYDNSINLCADNDDTFWVTNFMANEQVIVTGTLRADCRINQSCFDGCDFELDDISSTGL